MKHRWKMLMVLLALALALPGMANAQDPGSGEKLYKKHCKRCHGLDGKGKAKMLKPLKLVKEGIAILDITKEESKKLGEEEQVKLILEGKNKMKPLKKKLNAEQAKEIVTYVRTLQAAK